MSKFTGVKITGLKLVEANLNREIQGIKIRAGKGLAQFAIRVRREMSTIQPLTPIGKTRNLDHSWRAPLTWQGGSYILRMGFEANYAVYVHAFKDENTNWTRRGSGGQWFEKALQRNLPLLKADILTGK